MASLTRPAWTPAENELLRKHYAAAKTTASLLPLFPGRNAHGIRLQASRLQVKRRAAPCAWSAKDIAILKAYYPTAGSVYVAERVGRTPDRVRGYAYEHGIAYIGVGAKPAAEKKKRGPKPGAVFKPRAPKPVPVVAKAAKAPVQKAAPAPAPVPVKRSPATPNLNAQVARRKKEVTTPLGEILSAMKKTSCPPARRLAFTIAAHQGMPAAIKAWDEWPTQQQVA
jgi:hypothetical protein